MTSKPAIGVPVRAKSPFAPKLVDRLKRDADWLRGWLLATEKPSAESVLVQIKHDIDEVVPILAALSPPVAPADWVRVLRELLMTVRLLFQNAEACVRVHHGFAGLPGWLADCKATIDRAASPSPPNSAQGEARPTMDVETVAARLASHFSNVYANLPDNYGATFGKEGHSIKAWSKDDFRWMAHKALGYDTSEAAKAMAAQPPEASQEARGVERSDVLCECGHGRIHHDEETCCLIEHCS